MDPREAVRQRRDVSSADVEQIIEVAAGLQDVDQSAAARPTVAELEAVASELDILPAYIDQAIDRLREERQAAAEKASETAAFRAYIQRVGVRVGLLGLCCLLAFVGTLVFTLVM
jgi:hypothetical protein